MDMSGMAGMSGMEVGAAAKPGEPMPGMDTAGHNAHDLGVVEKTRDQILDRREAVQGASQGHDMSTMKTAAGGALAGPALPGSPAVMHGADTHGPGSSSIAMSARSRLDDPGSGFEGVECRVLVYTDLQRLTPLPDVRDPEREIELHITGNMERYMWSFNGKKYSEAKTPIPFRYGERLRLILVNDTMMEHPIHLHGMWMELENGQGARQPRKHTVNVKPAERLSVAITADAPGRWAMHCHLLLHMELGMFRVVEVSAPRQVTS